MNTEGSEEDREDGRMKTNKRYREKGERGEDGRRELKTKGRRGE